MLFTFVNKQGCNYYKSNYNNKNYNKAIFLAEFVLEGRLLLVK
jgi:hypothetical protein